LADAAIEIGIPTEKVFFGRDTARGLRNIGRTPDLIIGNNVLAHVPDLDDFVGGMALLLAPEGTITIEFPHLLQLMSHRQFDTIYHEHFSYFSMLAVRDVFRRRGLEIVDVEELSTHGGSLRIYARHADRAGVPSALVESVLARERAAGLDRLDAYERFTAEVDAVKVALLAFLHDAKQQGKVVAAYGAPAKGNTLLNYCGVTPELISFTVDRSPHKQGLLLPGSHIPIRSPEDLVQERPDYVVILPWNLKDEIIGQMHEVRTWGGRFVVPIPELAIVE